MGEMAEYYEEQDIGSDLDEDEEFYEERDPAWHGPDPWKWMKSFFRR